jgi:hypothetical protein
MADVKHTPGPWTIEEYGDDDCPALVIHKDTETRVCFMAAPGSHGDPARIEADARLIAAAPDMLTELRWLYEKHGYQSTADVIAKATAISP